MAKKTTAAEVLRIAREIMRDDTLNDSELLEREYLDEALIDSFQLVEMITALEVRFHVKFSAAELTSDGFRTLAGVVAIVDSNLKGAR